MGEPNLFKFRYRDPIRRIVSSIILDQVAGPYVVKQLIRELVGDDTDIADPDRAEVVGLN